MPKYRSNLRIGSWKRGEVFESDEEMYAQWAAEGYLTELDEVTKEIEAPPDETSASFGLSLDYRGEAYAPEGDDEESV